jgi:hypothetical protein
MAEKKDTDINELAKERKPSTGDACGAIYDLELGEYTSEVLSALIQLAVDHDLECGQVPVAILWDAYHDIKARTHKRS